MCSTSVSVYPPLASSERAGQLCENDAAALLALEELPLSELPRSTAAALLLDRLLFSATDERHAAVDDQSDLCDQQDAAALQALRELPLVELPRSSAAAVMLGELLFSEIQEDGNVVAKDEAELDDTNADPGYEEDMAALQKLHELPLVEIPRSSAAAVMLGELLFSGTQEDGNVVAKDETELDGTNADAGYEEDMAALQKLHELPLFEFPQSPSAAALSDSLLYATPENVEEARDTNYELDDDTAVKEGDAENEDDADTTFEQMMNRGSYLRELRLLALLDEQERQAWSPCDDASDEEKKEESDDIMPSNFSCDDVTLLQLEEQMQDSVRVLPTKEKVLDYESYLAHQRYYDDLKHVDIKYMDFGIVANRDEGRLIVEQRKSLGKGGFCWDAGFVLGEHVVAHEEEWKSPANAAPPRVVELGAGTGLSGLMIAKATRSDVLITDLPELEGLMRDNIRRNFGAGDSDGDGDSSPADGHSEGLTTRSDAARGSISSRVLRWGVEEDYIGAPYDVIIGADIVTSLYDPQALAQALHALSGPNTKIYISGKARLDRPHEEFDAEMERLFQRVERIDMPSSRLRSPDVFMIVAGGKRSLLSAANVVS